MTNALAIDTLHALLPALCDDLSAIGVDVIGAVESNEMVRAASRLGPDVVIVRESVPHDGLITLCAQLTQTCPCPLVVFTADPDVDRIARALDAGVTEYVVQGDTRARLRSVIETARLRFERDKRLQDDLQDIQHRFEERKLVDKAKGILMRARQLSEDEAFRLLRTASMQSHLRVGQVSRQVIDAARHADAVNRAGQLRALSQRLVNLYILRARQIEPQLGAQLMAQSVARIEETIGELPRRVSASTYADLFSAVAESWEALRSQLALPASPARIAQVDAHAERLLQKSEQLTANLEAAGLVTSLRVINLSGRQRMLSQRAAKLYLLSADADAPTLAGLAEESRRVSASLEHSLEILPQLPLSTQTTRDLLALAGDAWLQLKAACAKPPADENQWSVGTTSEQLLALFEQLTDEYERSMQVLIG